MNIGKQTAEEKRKARIKAPKRIDKLIAEMPKNDFKVSKAALRAGYSPSTAKKQTAQLRKTMENRLQELKEVYDKDFIERFFPISMLTKEYQQIITQNKDFSTKERATRAMLNKHGLGIGEEEKITTIPPIIINVIKPQDIPEKQTRVREYKAFSLASQNNPFANIDDTEEEGGGGSALDDEPAQ